MDRLPPMKIALLSGGVGGARMARALDRAGADLSVIVNVGDDEAILGVHVSPDVDTVMYTLAGVEGPEGWGVNDDSTTVMDRLGALGGDTRFTLGDRDLATHLFRTAALAKGTPLHEITALLAGRYGVKPTLLPATNDELRTEVRTDDGWLSFQEYFVLRGHQDPAREISFRGADLARPAPGVLEAIDRADVVVVAPSNPPLSIWPILAIPGIADAVADRRTVVAVSPLFGGSALKGPAREVMLAMGLPEGNAGVVSAYEGLISDLVVDQRDAADRTVLSGPDLRVHVADTRIVDPERAQEFGRWLLALLSN